jgi:hypothetical protein
MTVITMSRSEIDRMSVLRDLAGDRIRVSEAARLIGAWAPPSLTYDEQHEEPNLILSPSFPWSSYYSNGHKCRYFGQ